MHPIESNHEESSRREEYCLSDAWVDSWEIDISAIVDFFDKKQSQREETTPSQKYSGCHQWYPDERGGRRIHIPVEHPDRGTTRETYEEQDEEIRPKWHDYLTKKYNSSTLAYKISIFSLLATLPMHKNTHKNTDFFKEFRSSQIHKYLFSGGIAVFAAFWLVSFFHSDLDTAGLMASVAQISTPSVVYPADLIMSRSSTGMISLVFGAQAKWVDRVEFSILGDPARLHNLQTKNPDIQITSQPETGVYHVSIDMHGWDIIAGTQIATLMATIDTGAVLSLSDTEFVSGGVRYSLSSKGE